MFPEDSNKQKIRVSIPATVSLTITLPHDETITPDALKDKIRECIGDLLSVEIHHEMVGGTGIEDAYLHAIISRIPQYQIGAEILGREFPRKT